MKERCFNQNHSKMNVSIRNCIDCGQIVNKNISKKACNTTIHANARRTGSTYCPDCGVKLK